MYMRTLRFPFLDFLVSSVQFSVNKEVTTTQSLAFDAPSKLDNAKHGGQRLPITLRLRLRSWDVFADDLFPNHLTLRLDSWTGQPQMHRPKIHELCAQSYP